MKHYIFLILTCLCMAGTLFSQNSKDEVPRSVNEATLIGSGIYNVRDTYLSPFSYNGWGIRILNERMRTVKLLDYKVSRQQIINVDISSTHNPAENVTDFSGYVDYTLGYHYRLSLSPRLKLLAGGAGHFMGGFIYNTRNGNNPASAKADMDINLSVIALYNMQVKNTPLTIRYQGEVPFVGIMFAPHYGQSYYEIFNEGNTAGVFPFNSFHNKLAFNNYLTIDFPVSNWTIRAGYLNSFYRTDVNHIKTRVVSHSFMIGLVKEFISFEGKRMKQNNKFKSSYY